MKAKDNGNSVAYLNFLRVFASLLVILLHCIVPFYNELNFFETRAWWICAFINCVSRTAVPIFFMMSGYLLLSNSKTLEIKSFYKKRLPKLVIPLIGWNVIYYLYYNWQNLSLSEFLTQIIDTGTAYHLWFMYAMIGFYLLLPFIKRITDACTNKQLWLLTVILAFAGTIRPFINTTFSVYLYFFDGLANGYLPYFILGYLLGKTNFNIKLRFWVYLCGIIGAVTGIFGNWFFSSDAELNLVGNEGYGFNNMMCACAVFLLVKEIPWEKLPETTRVSARWSKRTLNIYLVHILILDICGKFMPRDITPVWWIACSFIITSVFSFVFAYLAEKIKIYHKNP